MDYAIGYGTGTLKVTPATTTVSSANPAVAGQTVTFIATVAVIAPGAGSPTGVVTFLDGEAIVGTAAIDAAGHATIATSSLIVGAHPMAASYSGDGNFTGSVSPMPVETVTSPSRASMADLMARVAALGLNQGQRNSLMAKLRAAQASLDRGSRTAAVNQLGAFINELQRLGDRGCGEREHRRCPRLRVINAEGLTGAP